MEFFQKRKWNINIQKYMLLDFLCFKKGILGWGKPSSEKVLNSKQISPPPLEKILATPQLMSVIVSFTISQNWNFVFFIYCGRRYIRSFHSSISLPSSPSQSKDVESFMSSTLCSSPSSPISGSWRTWTPRSLIGGLVYPAGKKPAWGGQSVHRSHYGAVHRLQCTESSVCGGNPVM